MTTSELEAYVHEHIPLTQAMELRVKRADPEEVRLIAPLEPNVNHQGTAFGGSIAALALAAGWITVRLHVGPIPQVVISECSITYRKPIVGELQAVCSAPPERDWERFQAKLNKRGRARLDLDVELVCGDESCVTMHGRYVAVLGNGA